VRFLLDHDVPDDIVFALAALEHEVLRLREQMATTTPDDEVLRFATRRDCVLITCNRDDFLALAARERHGGIIILIRRRSRALERAALVRLVDRSGEIGLRGNVNFA
jgi:predicted nuclease of predicted toxin-antitoxin system